VTPTAPKSVLVVDDNAFIRQALCEQFKREADFEVCGEAENGKEAIEKGQELRPVPLIMYSAFGDRLVENQARLIGISEVVSKSEHPSVLVHKARGLLYSAAA
jgi:chemotaxis response regulator CheB